MKLWRFRKAGKYSYKRSSEFPGSVPGFFIPCIENFFLQATGKCDNSNCSTTCLSGRQVKLIYTDYFHLTSTLRTAYCLLTLLSNVQYNLNQTIYPNILLFILTNISIARSEANVHRKQFLCCCSFCIR